jgi:hypothetical protein
VTATSADRPETNGLHRLDVDGFTRMVEALRRLQEDLTAASPPPALAAELTRTLNEAAARLRPFAVDEEHQIAGHCEDLPGRAQALIPPVHLHEMADTRVAGRVTFGRFYLGGNGAAHGGTLPLVFDELLGRLAGAGRSPSRTAYLHVNYRNITPIGRELRIEATFDREEGRKRFVTGRLFDGDTLCADAEGLFVALLPGQP